MADLYLSNVTGLLDIDSMVQGILQPKLQDLQKLQNKKATLQAQASAISNFLGALKDAQSFIDDLNIDNLFNAKSVNVEDTSILSATASDDTPNVTLSLNVTQLSQTEVLVSSQGVSDLNNSISASTFTLKYWTSDTDYETFDINFSGGTLQDLADTINSSQDKVEASIFYDGTYYKLMLSEKDVGASTKETTDTSTVIEIVGSLPTELGSLSIMQYAKNAEIQIGDSATPVTSPTNTFENIISGLSVTVYQTGTTSITVEDDHSGISSTLSDFLNKLNSIIDLVNSNTAKGGIFQGNIMFTQIKPRFLTLMQPLVNLGIINIDDEGKYSLNTDTLNSVIENNLEDFKTAISQVKENFSSDLENLISSFNTYKTAQDNQINYIDDEIEEMQLMISKEEERLRLEFAKIESLMYQNEQLRQKLQNFAVPISQTTQNS
ncbi:flagellar filament capping protein FliD [Thermodesulfobacterium hydrogeniphilum]|uniref:flagellar filament capping protein FliD n=1 Tax=Thermodesulfobacterium hydrogeniphilum TaxID=161156 RepID=UPI0005718FC6|nr:flagellar filament capping protein FliD [Thermodesulfobacterium hydrogeniphilum]